MFYLCYSLNDIFAFYFVFSLSYSFVSLLFSLVIF